MQPPKELTVLIDSREKKPLLFPDQLGWSDHRGHRRRFKINKSPVTLKTADYAVEQCPGTLFENKNAASEVYHNTCTADGRRFLAELKRLSEVRHPYLLLTFPVTEWRTCRYIPDPDKARDRLYRALQHYGINLLWIPAKTLYARRDLGGELIRIAWNHHWEDIHRLPSST